MRLRSLHCKSREPLSGKVWNKGKNFSFILRLPTKSIEISARKLGQRHKKSRGSPLLGIGYDDIKVLLDCLRFIPKLLFRNAINDFTGEIVSFLFVYLVDVSSITNVSTVLFPKRIVLKVACFFYKRKIRIAAICLGL